MVSVVGGLIQSPLASFLTHLVPRHGLDRLRLQDPHPVKLPAVNQHLAKLHHVGEGGEEAAARRQVRGFLGGWEGGCWLWGGVRV